MRTALIIIDMQIGSFTEDTPRYDATNIVKRLNNLANRVRQAGGLVIYFQHNGPEGDPLHPDCIGWKLLPNLEANESDCFISKTACDAFLETNLSSTLDEAKIGRLIITGCATDFCVDTTIRSALARGYDTLAPSDGHTTADRPYLNAEKIIEHHSAVWSEFISPGGVANVAPCASVSL